MFRGDGGNRVSSKCSFWWKDIINSVHFTFLDPIENFCRFSVHNAFSTPFWEARWLREWSLKETFPDIYELSRLKFVSVAVMGGWNDEEWQWGDFGVSGSDVVQCGL